MESPSPAVAFGRELILNLEADPTSQAPRKQKSVAGGESGSQQTQAADDTVEQQLDEALTQFHEGMTAVGSKLS